MASFEGGVGGGDLPRLDLEQVDEPVCRVTPCSLRDEGHRGSLVEKPQLPARLALQGGIPEDPAVLEYLIVIPHECSRVPDLQTELLELGDEPLDGRNPIPSQAAEALDLRLAEHPQVLGGQLEDEVRTPSDKAKPVHPFPGRDCQSNHGPI